MSQFDQFLSALKRSLKAKNILYKDLAKSLDLSESSVKRILSDKSISMDRLEQICRVADISLAEIFKKAKLDEVSLANYLSVEQEAELSKNVRLLHYYELLIEGFKPEEIEAQYMVSSQEAKRFLLILDKIKLIELHTKDRVRLLREGQFTFRPDGPLGKALYERMQASFLHFPFGSDDFIQFSSVPISPATLLKYKVKFEKLLGELQEEAYFEATHNVDVKDMGILIAYRPWAHSFMGSIQKKEKESSAE